MTIKRIIQPAHKHEVNHVAVSADNRLIASGGTEHVKVWDFQTGQHLQNAGENLGKVRWVAFTTDGSCLLALQYDTYHFPPMLWVMDVASGEIIIKHSRNSITCPTFADNSNAVFYAAGDHAIYRWQWQPERSLTPLIDRNTIRKQIGWDANRTYIRRLVPTPDGRLLLVFDQTNGIYIWDLVQARFPYRYRGYKDAVPLPDGVHAVCQTGQNTLALVELRQARVVKQLEGACKRISNLTLMPDGRFILALLPDSGIGVWEISSGSLVKVIAPQERHLHSLVVTTNSQSIITANGCNTIKVWPLNL